MAVIMIVHYFIIARRVPDMAGAVGTIYSLTAGAITIMTAIGAAITIAPWYSGKASHLMLITIIAALFCVAEIIYEQIIDS